MAVTRTGQPLPKFVPCTGAHRVAWITGRVLDAPGRRDQLLSADAIFLANVFRKMDNGKARRQLHWQPRPLSRTVADTVDLFAAQTRQPPE